MARLPVIAAAVLAIAASSPLMCATTSPATAREWRDRDADINRDLRDLLIDRIRTRQDLRDLLADLLENRPDLRGALRERIREAHAEGDEGEGLRGALRERMGDWRDRDDEDEGGLRGRLRERIAERRHGGDEGQCYFLTRSLRDEDGALIVRVTRRVCRD